MSSVYEAFTMKRRTLQSAVVNHVAYATVYTAPSTDDFLFAVVVPKVETFNSTGSNQLQIQVKDAYVSGLTHYNYNYTASVKTAGTSYAVNVMDPLNLIPQTRLKCDTNGNDLFFQTITSADVVTSRSPGNLKLFQQEQFQIKAATSAGAVYIDFEVIEFYGRSE